MTGLPCRNFSSIELILRKSTAAATIWARVRRLYPARRRLDPAAVLATPDRKLRAAGLSAAKTRALKDLAAKTIDGTVPSARRLMRMNDEEIITRLTSVRGIGP